MTEITCFQDKKLLLVFLQGGSVSNKLFQFLFIWGKSSFHFHFKKIPLLDIQDFWLTVFIFEYLDYIITLTLASIVSAEKSAILIRAPLQINFLKKRLGAIL